MLKPQKGNMNKMRLESTTEHLHSASDLAIFTSSSTR